MDNTKNNQYYLSRILKDINFLIKHTKDLEEVQFNQDEVLLDSIFFRLIQISENIKKLTDKIKTDNPQIPWISISGFRNRVVHEYGEVDLSIVYYIVKKDIYDLKILFNSLKK